MNYAELALKGRSVTPKPFPGKYPTRIAIFSEKGRNPDFTYHGKPVPELLRTIQTGYIRKGGRVTDLSITEFDQNGIIYYLRRGGLGTMAEFRNIYFPIPAFLFDNLDTMDRAYVLLARKSFAQVIRVCM